MSLELEASDIAIESDRFPALESADRLFMSIAILLLFIPSPPVLSRSGVISPPESIEIPFPALTVQVSVMIPEPSPKSVSEAVRSPPGAIWIPDPKGIKYF